MTPQYPHRADRLPGTPSPVLHVAHNSLPHMGGLETVVAAETRGLAARGWDVSLLCSDSGAEHGSRPEEGVRVERVRAWNGLESRFGVPFPIFSPWLLVATWRAVRRAELVHVHDPLYLSSWAAALCCRAQRTPYVVHRHVGFVHHSSFVVRMVQRVVLGTLGRLVLGGASAILPIDEFIATGTRSEVRDPQRVHVLGNGVDTTRFRPPVSGEREEIRREFRLPLDLPLVLFVGRFVPKKGFPLVAAAARDGYRMVFAGGDRPPEVDDPRLVFLGALPPDELARVYRCVDAFVVASVGECPLTVLEAMSSGVPVLLNEDPALHSAWTAGPGVRFVEMAAGDLAPAVESLVADPDAMAAMGAEGHRYVQEVFSWEVHLDQLEKVYRDALRDPRHD